MHLVISSIAQNKIKISSSTQYKNNPEKNYFRYVKRELTVKDCEICICG